jgi:hypothetical protein
MTSIIEAVRGDSLSRSHAEFVQVWTEDYFGHVPATRDLEKASVDWCLFLTSGGKLVGHVALSKMSILLDDQIRVAGAIGGLFTARPEMRQGFANLIMDRAEEFIFRDLGVDLGILFCLPELVPFYARRRWALVGVPVTLEQTTGVVTWSEAVMVLPPNGESWSDKKIHVPSQCRPVITDI